MSLVNSLVLVLLWINLGIEPQLQNAKPPSVVSNYHSSLQQSYSKAETTTVAQSQGNSDKIRRASELYGFSLTNQEIEALGSGRPINIGKKRTAEIHQILLKASGSGVPDKVSPQQGPEGLVWFTFSESIGFSPNNRSNSKLARETKSLKDSNLKQNSLLAANKNKIGIALNTGGRTCKFYLSLTGGSIEYPDE